MTDTSIVKPLNDRELLLGGLPIVILQAAFFLVPLAMTCVLTFQGMKFYQLHWTWDLATWEEIFGKRYYWSILLRTVLTAALTVGLCLLISLPVTYCVVNRIPELDGHFKSLVIFIFVTDAVLKTYGWVLFLDEKGILNASAQILGFGEGATKLLYTPVGTVLGMVYNLLPFMIFTVYLSMRNIDRELLHAAYDAGASKIRSFWEVTLPLSRPGIWAGSVIVFILSVGAFLEPRVLGGGKSPMVAEMIRLTFETRVNWPLGAAITVMLIVTTVLCVSIFTRLLWARRERAV